MIQFPPASEVPSEGKSGVWLMADAVPQIVWTSSPDGFVDYVNRHGVEYTGREFMPSPAVELVGRVVHPEDAPDLLRKFRDAARTGDTFSGEPRLLGRDGTYRWFLVRAHKLFDADTKAVTRWVGTAIDIHDRKRAEEALRLSERRLQLVQQAARIGSFDFERASNKATASAEYRQLYGIGESIGGKFSFDDWLALVHPEDRDRVAAETAAAVADPGRTYLDYEFRIIRADTGELRWISARTELFRDDAGRFVRSIGAQWDITTQKLAGERMGVMIAELQHRTRNLLTVVGSLSSQTARETDSLPIFLDVFNERLAALARVQGLLSRKESEPITIGALVRSELDALGALNADSTKAQIAVAGPDIILRPTIVQTLALAIHELATNARKYGALSQPKGRLGVDWSTRADGATGPHLVFRWRETGIATSPQPQTGGFGRTLIERALPYSMGAQTRYALTEVELDCSIDLPLHGEV